MAVGIGHDRTEAPGADARMADDLAAGRTQGRNRLGDRSDQEAEAVPVGTTDAPLHLPAGRTDAEFDRRLAAHDAQVRAERPPGRPEVVVLCGSTRFEDAFTEAMRDQTLAGRIVLSVGLFDKPSRWSPKRRQWSTVITTVIVVNQ